jgi:hypothetical protein
MRRTAWILGAAALSAAFAAGATAKRAARPALPVALALEAEFLHGPTGVGYRTRLGGVLSPVAWRLADGSLTLDFLVEPVGCRVGAWWARGDTLPPPPSDDSTSPPPTAPPASAATRPAELCLARAETGDAEIADWLAGASAADPRLRVHLLPVGTAEPGTSAYSTAPPST